MAHSLFYPVKRTPLVLLGVEPWRTAFEFLSHKVTPPHSQPVIGDGHPVLIFPGLGADGRSVEPLRKFCESLGYSAFDWGLGFNKGPQDDVDTWLSGLAKHSSDLLNDHGQTITLIRWSSGGLYAREIAKSAIFCINSYRPS